MRLADLKRIKVGTKLRLVHCLLGPCDWPREVTEVLSTGIWMKRLDENPDSVSWLSYPKAKDFRDDGDGFSIMEGDEVAVQYKFGLAEEGKVLS